MSLQRDHFYQLYRLNSNQQAYNYFKKLRRLCNKIATKDKGAFLQNKILQNRNKKLKEMWKVMKMFFKNSEIVEINEIMYENKKITDLQEISDKFNDYFIQLISSLPLVTRFEYLGFWIQNDLKFDFQADTLLKKLSFCNLSLSRASRFLNYESLLLLYKSFHLSYVLYYKYVLRFIGKCKTRKISSKMYVVL